jgi:hypothetical protein
MTGTYQCGELIPACLMSRPSPPGSAKLFRKKQAVRGGWRLSKAPGRSLNHILGIPGLDAPTFPSKPPLTVNQFSVFAGNGTIHSQLYSGRILGRYIFPPQLTRRRNLPSSRIFKLRLRALSSSSSFFSLQCYACFSAVHIHKSNPTRSVEKSVSVSHGFSYGHGYYSGQTAA